MELRGARRGREETTLTKALDLERPNLARLESNGQPDLAFQPRVMATDSEEEREERRNDVALSQKPFYQESSREQRRLILFCRAFPLAPALSWGLIAAFALFATRTHFAPKTTGRSLVRLAVARFVNSNYIYFRL